MKFEKLKRTATQVFLIVILCLVLIDGLPVGWPIHAVMKKRIDIVLDKTGLWQSGWKLFAPEPDRVNMKVSARVTFVDGTEQLWSHPDWSSLSVWQRTRHFRLMDFYDDVRADRSKKCWDAFAAFIARETVHLDNPQIAVDQVFLIRSWAKMKDPSSARKQPLEGTRFTTGLFEFHTWTATP